MPKANLANGNRLYRPAKATTREERNVFLQILFYSPKDTLAGALALTAVLAIVGNAVFVQTGRHPSPLFGTTARLAPLSKPVAPAEPPIKALVQNEAPINALSPVQPVTSPMPRPRPPEAGIRSGDPLGNLVRATSTSTTASDVPRPPIGVPAASSTHQRSDPVANLIVSSQRVAAVQRVLTDYGYGQIKATGTVGADTQAAIQKFEQDRKLPPTGQMSERLVKELGLATGRSFD